MANKFEIVETPARPALTVRTVTSVGSLPQEIGKAYGAILAYMGGLGEQPADAAFVAYYNMDMEKLDVEIGFPTSRELPGSGEIKPSTIPEGRKAICMYKGPYKDMGPTYEEMTKWMTENGHEPTGVVYEYYYNSPMEVEESELLTKISFVLK